MSDDREMIIKDACKALLEKGDLEVIDSVFSVDYVAHAGSRQFKGHAFIKEFMRQLHKALPDMKLVKIEFLAQTNDRVVWQRTLKGTHEAAMQGAPASGKKLTWTEMLTSRFEGDKIVEEWLVSELAGEMLSKKPRAS